MVVERDEATKVQLGNLTSGVSALFSNIDEKITADGTLLMKYYTTSTIRIELYGLDPDKAYTWYVIDRDTREVQKIDSLRMQLQR
jgi:hypothetical protein